MTVTVLITRTVPREKGREMISLFKEMRSLAADQPGYPYGTGSNEMKDITNAT